MKLIQEVVRSFQRIDTPDQLSSDQLAQSEYDDGVENAELAGNQDSATYDPDQVDQDGDQPSELDSVVSDAVEDPDRQGLIRTVSQAHLVFKREVDDGTFTELWLYNIQQMHQQTKVKRAILAGTDIPPNSLQSPDGSQTYRIWAVGNVEMLEITGLPS